MRPVDYLTQITVKCSRIATLPLMPDVVLHLLWLTGEENATLREYERILCTSPALMAKILRVANSPYYSRGGTLTTPRAALAYLGSSTVRSICLTTAFQSQAALPLLSQQFDVKAFWRHSLAVASSAKVLACLYGYPAEQEAFVAGLLHDIGKLALALFLPEEWDAIRAYQRSHRVSDFEAEQAVMGITHQDIGRLLIEQWNLPAPYLSAICRHHVPLKDVQEIDPLTAFVHVGNTLAYECELGFSPPGSGNEAEPFIVDFLGVSQEQYATIRPVIVRQVERIEQFLQFPVPVTI